jgi:hypothetical protein
MKLYDKVSSFQGANTLFQGQQINGQTHREEKRDTEERSLKEITEQITEKRSKERPETQSQRVITHCKRDCKGD